MFCRVTPKRQIESVRLYMPNKYLPTCSHTSAMVVLQATQDIRKVSLWLGHSSLTTTEVYIRADPTEKLEAIEAVVPPSLRKGKFRPPDKLLELLKGKS